MKIIYNINARGSLHALFSPHVWVRRQLCEEWTSLDPVHVMELYALGFCYVQLSQASLWHLARANQDAQHAPHPNPGRKKAVSSLLVQRHQVAHPNVHSTLKTESGFL